MRLIDADALPRQTQIFEFNGKRMENEIVNAKSIDNAPTIDAVPVVRCKHCRFSEVFQNDSSGVMARYCNAFKLVRMVADGDYCSYGERRDDA